MYPLRRLEIPVYLTTCPEKYETIYILAKDEFGKNIGIQTNLNEIEHMRDLIKSQKKIKQFEKYIQ